VIFGEISLNNSATAYLSLIYLNTTRLECVESFFDFVIKGSINIRKAFALAVVVRIRLFKINDAAIFANRAFLCALFRLK
jgi:hypothetical protein